MKTLQRLFFILIFSTANLISFTQDPFGYQKPPKVIGDLLLASPTPGVSIDKQKNYPKLSQTLTPILSKNLGADTQHPL
jgi:hypothetical protein